MGTLLHLSSLLLICSLVSLTCYGAGASKIFQDLGSNFLESDLENWDVPTEYRLNLTYYLSGYDDEGSPVWVAEWGNWNFRKFFEQGREGAEVLDKYVDQIALNVIKSFDTNSTNPARSQAVGIIDIEGFTYYQIASAPTLRYILRKFGFFNKLISKHIKAAITINTNFAAQSLVSMLRPVLGESMERFEFYGSSKAKWMKRILENVPQDQLPEWYGGSKDFVPVKVYG